MSESDVDEAFDRLKELYQDFKDALKNSRDDFDSVEADFKSHLAKIGNSGYLLNAEHCDLLHTANRFINSPHARFLSRREQKRSRSRPRPGDSYWVLYCIYNTCKYWVYPILTIGIVIFPLQYKTIKFFKENSGILRKVKQTGEKQK